MLKLGRATAKRIFAKIIAIQTHKEQNTLYGRILGQLYEDLGGPSHEVFIIPDADNPIVQTGIRKTSDGWTLFGVGFDGEALDPPPSTVGASEGSERGNP